MECFPRRLFSGLLRAALTARRINKAWAVQNTTEKRQAPLFLIVLAVFITLSSLPAAAQSKIGLSLPLSGPVEKLGRQFLAGAKLKLEEHNRQAETPVELAIADDRCDGDVAGLSADELRQSGAGLITGILCNAVAFELADAFKQSAIPLLVAGARAPSRAAAIMASSSCPGVRGVSVMQVSRGTPLPGAAHSLRQVR